MWKGGWSNAYWNCNYRLADMTAEPVLNISLALKGGLA